MLRQSPSLVILVNEQDEPIGTMEKMEVHRKGLLHRAFSVFVRNERGEILLQQRAIEKYHCGGLWTNTCCSHPFPEENIVDAAHRRLLEEMGFDCQLKKIFNFTYRAHFSNGLIEHEYDHVLLGQYDGPVLPDSAEVQDYAFLSVDVISKKLLSDPDVFTPWFHIAFSKMKNFL